MEMDTPIENVLTVETVLDKYNNDAGIAPFNHGAPADANKTPMAIATNEATTTTANQVNACVLCKMKHLEDGLIQWGSSILHAARKMKSLK